MRRPAFTTTALASVAAAALLLAPGRAHAGNNGNYTIGFAASTGNALLPTTASNGLSTSIQVHEYGGWVGRILTLILTAPRAPTGRTDVSSSTSCSGDYCVVTTTTTTYAPTQAEIDRYHAEVKNWSENTAPMILSGALRTEVTAEWMSQDLGGDTSGGMFSLTYNFPIGSLRNLGGNFNFGMAVGGYTFHDRTWKEVENTGGVLDAVEKTGDLEYDYIGIPMRFSVMARRDLQAYVQMDFNILGLSLFDEDAQPSPARVGFTYLMPHLYLRGEVVTDNFGTHGISGLAELGLAF